MKIETYIKTKVEVEVDINKIVNKLIEDNFTVIYDDLLESLTTDPQSYIENPAIDIDSDLEVKIQLEQGIYDELRNKLKNLC